MSGLAGTWVPWLIMVAAVAVVMAVTAAGRAAAPRLLSWARRHWIVLTWSALIVAGVVLLPRWSALIVLAGVVGWVILVSRARRRRRVERGRALPRQVEARSVPHPDAALVARVYRDWSPACAAHGVCVADPDLTLRLRQIEADARHPGEGLSAALTVATAAATERGLRAQPGVEVVGSSVVRTPVIVSVGSSPVGPVLTVARPDGLTAAAVAARAEDLASALRVPAISVSESAADRAHRGASVTLRLRDPLAEPMVLSSVPAATDLASVPVAIGEDGGWRYRSYANVSGAVVGGHPGAGKTGGESSVIARLIQHPAVQVLTIDGKGGGDWSWIAPRASVYLSEDEELERVAEVTGALRQVMRSRLQSQLADRDASNFWSVPLDPEHPFWLLVIDEVQSFTDLRSLAKEAKPVAERIISDLLTLVRKGRSAGVYVLSMTQKPTTDSIPSAMRDNCSVRTSYRVMTRDAAVSVLGEAVSGSEVRPSDIPEGMPGVAVMSDGAGGLERVRFPFVPEADLARIAMETAHLRRPLMDEEVA